MKKLVLTALALTLAFSMSAISSYAQCNTCNSPNCKCTQDCKCGCQTQDKKECKCACEEGKCNCDENCSCKKDKKFLFFHTDKCSGKCDCAPTCKCKS